MIVLDTNVLIWWLNQPEKLTDKVKTEIEKAKKDKKILISSISIWEICLLVKKGKLDLNKDIKIWVERLESLAFVQIVPVDSMIAVRSVFLNNEFHKDPADRIIVATAQILGAKLATSDKKIIKYKEVETVS